MKRGLCSLYARGDDVDQIRYECCDDQDEKDLAVESTNEIPQSLTEIGDKCADDNVCDHNCFMRNGNELCSCRNGFYLETDGASCRRTDENEDCSGDRCGEKCSNKPGSPKCEVSNITCSSGFEFDEISRKCRGN